MDRSSGVFTTVKLQSLIDCGVVADIGSRQALARKLSDAGHRISVHGIEAWFRRVDSNYSQPRSSLIDGQHSYALPRRRWSALLHAFDLEEDKLELSDSQFRAWCLSRKGAPQRQVPIGRAEEAEVVDVLARAAFDGHPRLLVLQGEPGIGKSHLLNRVREWLQADADVCLTCRGIAESELPLAALMSALQGGMPEALGAELRGIADDYLSKRAPHAGNPAEIFTQLADVLGRVAKEGTLLICLDDLQWLDRATLNFLEHFWLYCCNLPRCAFLLVVGSRELTPDSPHAAWLQGARRDERVRVQPLEPLNRRHTEELVNAIDARPKSLRFHQLIWEISLGNPLFATEVFRYFMREDRVYDRSGYLEIRAQPDVIQPSEGVAAIFRQDIAALGEATRSVLIRAAALTDEYNVAKLSAWLRLPVDEVMLAFDEAERAGLITWQADRVRLRHPILRQVLCDFPTRTEWARVNYELAHNYCLSRPDLSDMERVRAASLYLRGRLLVEPALFFELMKEASVAAKSLSAWTLAVNFAQAALDAAEDLVVPAAEIDELRLSLARSQHQLGRINEAIEQLDQVLVRPSLSPSDEPYVIALEEKVRILCNFRKLRDANSPLITELERLARTIAHSNRSLAGRALVTLSACDLYIADASRAQGLSREGAELIESEGDPELIRAFIQQGLSELRFAAVSKADACFERACSLASSQKNVGLEAKVHQRSSMSRYALGDVDGAQAAARRARDLGQSIYHTGEATLSIAVELCVASMNGEHSVVDERFFEAERLSNASGYRWASNYFLGGYLASLHARGHAEAIRETLDSVFGDADLAAAIDQRLFQNYRCMTLGDGEYYFSSFDPNRCDAQRVTRYCMDAERLLQFPRKGDDEAVATCLAALRFLMGQGVRVALGVPYFVPLQLARLAHQLGLHEESALNLHAARELIAQGCAGFAPQVDAFEASVAA